MSRPRSVPDAKVMSVVRKLLASGGERAASFAAVSQAAGLAGSSLVQRYGSRQGMVRAALVDGWSDLMARTEAAAGAAPRGAKGGTGFLKQLERGGGDLIALLAPRQRDPALRDLAEGWRARVEAELALRIGTGEGQKPARARDAATLAFAAWLGRLLWQQAGPGGATGLKLKTIVRGRG
ncbi:transcriptional regulator [Defluviimonas sp. 20V17]|uniref:TetR family transcriptional regulator n=1 Tax=Allgaiera indica TaxID=765699 RepID=A0AAN4UUN8_9RHOB|nr:hypothetical protein [Allgaiera indica]KDB05482.1 transcriptional regulator [Defluviimonas sp. 20V17]GHE04632.1 TetR family transcriptional regulator [Allgaiera indica]SDX47998.1 hypothetical protein SAMN05444006_11753 [Allgaiera indica]